MNAHVATFYLEHAQVEMLSRCVAAYRDPSLVDAAVLAIETLIDDVIHFAEAWADVRRTHPPVPHEVN